MMQAKRDAAGSGSAGSTAWQGSLAHHVAHEFFSNSSHFPLANVLLEALLQGREIFFEPGVYALLAGGLIQAWFLGRWSLQGKGRLFLGNLVGPAFYTAFELAFEGIKFFEGYNHWAYWGFSLAIGSCAALGARLPGRRGEPFVVLENVARTLIMLGMYWIFEILSKPANASPAVFFGDGSHTFFALVVVLLGIILGFERVNARRRMAQVAGLNARLGEYSEWLLGRELLHRALADPDAALGLRRRQRHMLFMDIRGFTAWSETQSPERVVDMLNRYFALAEEVCGAFGAVKAKYTGDEVMAVFERGTDAVGAAAAFTDRAGTLLGGFGLGAGIGIHCGPLMEGALGSATIKAYDVIGDTVNTAKRLCDNAAPGEVLVSRAALDGLETEELHGFAPGEEREVRAKGKREPVLARALERAGA